MNPQGRPRKMSYADLEPLIRSLREEGLSLKAIGTRLGYSADHIKKLCTRFHIYERERSYNPIEGIASDELLA